MLKHVSRTDDWSDKNIAQKGFTLIELLVVVIILGILAAVVIFAVGNTTDDAQTSSCDVEERTMRTAVQAWHANPDNTGTPTETGLVPDYLESASDNFNLDTNGDVVVDTNGDC